MKEQTREDPKILGRGGTADASLGKDRGIRRSVHQPKI